MRVLRQSLAVLLAVAVVVLCSRESPVSAQAKKAPLITPAPQAPTITSVGPNGAQRGTSVELRIVGTNLEEPVAIWTSFPAKAEVQSEKAKDATKARVKLDVPADAPIGVHTLRVAAKNGVSNALTFCVDDLPQIVEVDTNRTKSTAQLIPIPGVVLGRTDAEMSDFFKIDVKAGQRVTIETLGRRLGSAIDPIILLHDAKTGRELPGLYSDDAPGLQSDARLTHTFKEAGEFLIEVRDSTHRGGPDFFYRLRLGDFPAVLSAIPSALKRGAKASISFTGPAVEGLQPIEITAPTDPTKAVIYVAPKGGWPVPIMLSDIDEMAEVEPNNEPAKANKLPIPGGVTGRFSDKGDIDVFSFPVKKGVKYAIVAETYEINSPAEVYMTLKNAKGAELGKSTPTAPAARIDYATAEDGEVLLHVEHLNYAHGPNEVYRVSVRPNEPDFDIAVGIDRFEAAPGGTVLIPITAINRRDYTGPIELTIAGPAELSGTATIAAGMPAAPPATTLTYLPLHVKAGTKPGPIEFQVKAIAKVNGKEIIRIASANDVVKARMANLPFPPREMQSSLAIGVIDKPLFQLTAKLPIPAVKTGTPVNIMIDAGRAMGFADEITLTAIHLPANVTATPKPIAKGTEEIALQVTAAANAAPGPATLFVKGSAKVGGKDYVLYSAPITFTITADAKKDDKKDEKKDPPKDKPKDKDKK